VFEQDFFQSTSQISNYVSDTVSPRQLAHQPVLNHHTLHHFDRGACLPVAPRLGLVSSESVRGLFHLLIDEHHAGLSSVVFTPGIPGPLAGAATGAEAGAALSAVLAACVKANVAAIRQTIKDRAMRFIGWCLHSRDDFSVS